MLPSKDFMNQTFLHFIKVCQNDAKLCGFKTNSNLCYENEKIYVVFVFLLTKLKRNLHIPVQKFISILFFERQLKYTFDNEKMFWTALKEKYFWIRIISQRVKKHFFYNWSVCREVLRGILKTMNEALGIFHDSIENIVSIRFCKMVFVFPLTKSRINLHFPVWMSFQVFFLFKNNWSIISIIRKNVLDNVKRKIILKSDASSVRKKAYYLQALYLRWNTKMKFKNCEKPVVFFINKKKVCDL